MAQDDAAGRVTAVGHVSTGSGGRGCLEQKQSHVFSCS